MTFGIILIGMFTLHAVCSRDSGSGEINKIEVNPYFDAIIFSDVADIINEPDNNMNPFENLLNSGSGSDESIEDLLSEYQHYLEKAYKQHMEYLERKTKNKVPMIRHDRYTKSKPTDGLKYNNYIYNANGYFTQNSIPQTFKNPLDLFIPASSKFRYVNKSDQAQPKDNRNEVTMEKRIIELPLMYPKSRYDYTTSPCYCKKGQIPCDCKCKQCFLQFDSFPQINERDIPIPLETTNKAYLPNTEYANEESLRDPSDNTLNIRIKVDIQMPKTQDALTKLYKNRSREDIKNSKETTVNLPFPYFNFPIPMDMFGYKKSSTSHDLPNKITIHKKKKARQSNGNKKHRNKKVITLHNISIQPQLSVKTFVEDKVHLNKTGSDYNTKASNNSKQISFNQTASYLFTTQPEINTTTTTLTNNNDFQTEEGIFVMVNITNTNDNGTDDIHKNENSVETEYTKIDANVATERIPIMRRKRHLSPENTTESVKVLPLNVSGLVKNKSITKQIENATVKSLHVKHNDSKKSEKVFLADSELVYWPNNYRNQSVPPSKNITTIILERENKKAKLNMTKEVIRSNRTRALERAIFGEVNWDDVDTVAPVFLSFVGKYLRGVLTFCSQNICHSMKCAEKTCVHRTCAPNERWNQRGHCAGSNSTDTVASLESILDLPSNVAFEIVDILQDKMLGKLFGKVTLCISSKCISFVASKKNFVKSKCTAKELKTDHCPNIKNFKLV